ncbi:MAG: hypothetical protein JRN59_06095 [Nitrososphaerota archaeon]|jgi:L-lactate utilization protein LutC|nr:hypothetical protein [Nitrososphaerota archaeon]
MARSDYESLIATKPVVRKIERYRKEKGFPSRSQALAAIINDVEKEQSLKKYVAQLVEMLKELLERLRAEVKDKTIDSMIESILSLIVTSLQTSVIQS